MIKTSSAHITETRDLVATNLSVTGVMESTSTFAVPQVDLTSGNFAVSLAPPTLTSSYSLTLPPDAGDAQEFLQTDGGGVSTWQRATHYYDTRANFVTASSGLGALPEGSVVSAAGDLYRKATGSSTLQGLDDWLPHNDVWVEHFGAVTVAGRANANSTGIDNTTAIQGAIDYVETFNGGKVFLRGNYYRVATPLTVTTRGVIITGMGDEETYIFADHTAGPVIQFFHRTGQVHNIAIDASDTRRDSGLLASTNYGILYQTPDVPAVTERLQNHYLQAVRISNQPSHGLYASVKAFTGTADRCWFINNKGHGVLIDRGVHSGMVNPDGTSGLVTFNECQVSGNEGNGMAFGNSADTVSSTQCLRVIVSNCEIGANASGVAAEEVTQVYMYGCTDMLFVTNVFTSDGVANSGGVHVVGGRNIFISNNRFIELDSAIVIDSNAVLDTIGVFIYGFNVINSASMVEAIRVQNTSGDSTKEPRGISISQYNYIGGIDTLIATGTGMDPGSGAWRVPELGIDGRTMVSRKLVDQTVTNSTVLVEDATLKFWAIPSEIITFTFVVRYSGPAAGDVKMRLTGPTGSTIHVGVPSNMKVDASDAVVIQNEVAGDVDITFGTAASVRVATLVGSVTNGGTAGKVYLQWAQATADAGTTTVAEDSYVNLDRITV